MLESRAAMKAALICCLFCCYIENLVRQETALRYMATGKGKEGGGYLWWEIGKGKEGGGCRGDTWERLRGRNGRKIKNGKKEKYLVRRRRGITIGDGLSIHTTGEETQWRKLKREKRNAAAAGEGNSGRTAVGEEKGHKEKMKKIEKIKEKGKEELYTWVGNWKGEGGRWMQWRYKGEAEREKRGKNEK